LLFPTSPGKTSGRRAEHAALLRSDTPILVLSDMEFTVEFYETRNGRSPVRDFLEELKHTDSLDHAAVLRGLAKLRNRKYHREPLSKALGLGLFELRHVGRLNTRILWFFMKGRRIIAVHGIRNKGQAIPARELDTARERMRDWQERFGT
jgi:phage-related protein